MKSKTVAAVYHSYRLVENKDGSKEFLNKKQFINKNYPGDRRNGERIFKGFNTLWSAYEIDDNNLATVKKGYEKYVTQDLIHHIKNKSSDLCSKVDGSLTETDRSAIHANAITRYIVQHKGVFIRFF